MSVTALVLAGVRPGGDGLAEFAGVSHKALIEIGGVTMLDRVIAALQASGRFDRIVVSIDRPEIVTRQDVEVMRAGPTLADSVGDAIDRLGTPLLLTTADHALLKPEWVRYFLDNLPEVSVSVAVARKKFVRRALPETKRTYLRLADGAFSGCNMFLLRDDEVTKALDAWREFEALRKKPIQLLQKLGPRAIAAYAIGKLTVARAAEAAKRVAGVSCGIVEMPFGLAAVDVDKPDDLILVRRLIEGA